MNSRSRTVTLVFAFAFAVHAPGAALADFLSVPGQYPDVQSAIDAAPEGAVIQVEAGTWPGDLDFRGKALVVQGTGPSSVLLGTGTGPVVRFTSGEGPLSVLDSFTITGGRASRGGAVLIENSSPTVLRNVITGNAATQAGSGVYVGGAAAEPRIYNNLMIFNVGVQGGDPHTIQVVGSSPSIVNNTLARNDSNAILTTGVAAPDIRNNIFARNGSKTVFGGVKGRGICDFATSSAIRFNLFFRNVRSALLTAGMDYRRIRQAEEALGRPGLSGNLDAAPRFTAGPIPRDPAVAVPGDFVPSEDASRPSRAVGAGDPDPAWDDVDGSRNTIGFTGGPFAPAWF